MTAKKEILQLQGKLRDATNLVDNYVTATKDKTARETIKRLQTENVMLQKKMTNTITVLGRADKKHKEAIKLLDKVGGTAMSKNAFI